MVERRDGDQSVVARMLYDFIAGRTCLMRDEPVAGGERDQKYDRAQEREQRAGRPPGPSARARSIASRRLRYFRGAKQRRTKTPQSPVRAATGPRIPWLAWAAGVECVAPV